MHWKVFVKNRWDWSSLGFSLQWRFMKPPFAMSFDDDEKEFGKKRKTTAMPKCSSKRGDKIVEIKMNFSREKTVEIEKLFSSTVNHLWKLFLQNWIFHAKKSCDLSWLFVGFDRGGRQEWFSPLLQISC